jgi:hypothetical protein
MDLAPRPPPSTVSKLSIFLSFPVRCFSVEFTDEKGGGGGRGAKSYEREKAWPSINHSIFSP